MSEPQQRIKVITEREEKDAAGNTVTYYDFRCPYRLGCGEDAADPEATPFFSAGWLDREHAVARGKQHIAEHESGEPMPELHDFRTERGLTQQSAGQDALPADWEF